MNRMKKIALAWLTVVCAETGCSATVETPAGNTCVTTCDNDKVTCVAKCTDDTCKATCQTTHDSCVSQCKPTGTGGAASTSTGGAPSGSGY